jgi:YD repeat-containing protein
VGLAKRSAPTHRRPILLLLRACASRRALFVRVAKVHSVARRPPPRVITYTYDPLNRLTPVQHSTGESFGYHYGAADRLTSVDSLTYTQDEHEAT